MLLEIVWVFVFFFWLAVLYVILDYPSLVKKDCLRTEDSKSGFIGEISFVSFRLKDFGGLIAAQTCLTFM